MEKASYTSALSAINHDRRHIWHPFTQEKIAPPPLLVSHGKGSHFFTEDGRKIFDGISSWWVNLHGHAHPYIAQKVAAQARKLEHIVFAGCTHRPAIDLATKLSRILPGNLTRTFFSDNGSTAVEAAIKIAIQYWSNKESPTPKMAKEPLKIGCFKKSYHGDTFGAMSAAGKNNFNRPFWSYLFDVEQIDIPTNGNEELSISQAQEITRNRDLAAFIYEPLILGAGGMTTYSSSGLESILQLMKNNGALLIADEVMTGFGRIGPMFASNSLSVTPDIICLSKGLTGGFLPLGATVCTNDIYDQFYHDELERAFLHGHSYTANPIACQSALASIDLLEKEECEKQRRTIEKNHSHFCKKWSDSPLLSRCEYIGTILILEYNFSHATTSFFNPQIKESLSAFFLSKNILIRPLGNVVYIMPPYCATEDELLYVYDVIEQSFTHFQKS